MNSATPHSDRGRPQPDEAIAAELLAEIPVLRDKIAAALGCSEKVSHRALVEVLRFLDLIADGNEVLTPSHRVDLAWHEFILCTRAYDRYCRERFGRFIHHTPGGDVADNVRQFQRTLDLYRQRFGEANPHFWAQREFESEPGCGACKADH